MNSRRLAWGIVAEIERVIPSLVAFAVLPRYFGPETYGELASLIAVITLAASLATGGASLMYIRDRERGRRTERRLVGRAVLTSETLGFIGVIVLVPLSAIALPSIPLAPILLIGAAEMLLGNVVHIMSAIALGREDQFALATIVGTQSLSRILAVAIFLLTPLVGSLTGYAIAWLSMAPMPIVVGLWFLKARSLYHGIELETPSRSDFGSGLSIAATASAFYAQDGLDTPLLLKAGYAADAGNYAVAYRIASLSFVPVNALVLMAVPRTTAGKYRNGSAALRTALFMTLLACTYSLIILFAILLTAPLIENIVGSQYSSVVSILRWLSLLPLLRSTQYFVGNLLTLNGGQSARLVSQGVSMFVAVMLYLILIPRYSWQGAVGATYASEIVLACGLWIATTRKMSHLRVLKADALDLESLEL